MRHKLNPVKIRFQQLMTELIFAMYTLWLGLKYNLSIEQICGILLFNVTIVQWHDGELKLLFNFVIAQLHIW